MVRMTLLIGSFVGDASIVGVLRTVGERFVVVFAAMHAGDREWAERRRIVVRRVHGNPFGTTRVELCRSFDWVGHEEMQSKADADAVP